MTEPPSGWTTPGQAPPPQVPQWAAGPTYGAGAPWADSTPTWYAAPQPGVIPLRPLGLGEILDAAIKVIRRYPRPTLGLSAGIAAVITVLNVLVTVLVDRKSTSVTYADSQGVSHDYNLSGIPIQLIGFLGGLILTGALVAVVGRAVLGQPAPTGEMWTAVRSRVWALIGLSLLTVLIVFSPIILAVVIALLANSAGLAVLLILASFVPTSYLYIRFSLATAVLVLEKSSIRTALRRSGVLVRGAWWRTFGILLLAVVIVFFISLILLVPVAIFSDVASGGTESTGWLVVTQVLTGVLSVFISPFGAGVRAMVYVDRRMRAEGLDVSLQAAATAPRTP